ncbi:MAG: hypothetical protein GVY19_08160 [Bacteroidetes bacterium]|nr:hypothetical protein [Bacteroidota bacterium]
MGKRQCGKNAKGTAQPKAGRRYLRKIPGKNPGTKAKQTHDKPGGYQALEREEIHFLEPTDINLEKGTVRIRKNTQLQGRVLKLTANQILPLQEYMSEIRPEFVKLKGKQSGLSGVAKTEKLFIIIGTSQHIKDSMRELHRN